MIFQILNIIFDMLRSLAYNNNIQLHQYYLIFELKVINKFSRWFILSTKLTILKVRLASISKISVWILKIILDLCTIYVRKRFALYTC